MSTMQPIPGIKGGAEKRVYDLALRMAQRGHEVHCYSWGWWWAEEGKKDIILDGIHLHGVGEPRELYTDNRRSISEAILFAFKLTPLLWKVKFGGWWTVRGFLSSPASRPSFIP